MPVRNRDPSVSPNRAQSRQAELTRPASETTAMQKLTHACNKHGGRLKRAGQEYGRRLAQASKNFGRGPTQPRENHGRTTEEEHGKAHGPTTEEKHGKAHGPTTEEKHGKAHDLTTEHRKAHGQTTEETHGKAHDPPTAEKHRKAHDPTTEEEYRIAHDYIDQMCRDIVQEMWDKHFDEARQMWSELIQEFDLRVDPGDRGPADSEYERCWIKVNLARLDYRYEHYSSLQAALRDEFLARAVVKICLDRGKKNLKYLWAVKIIGTQNHELQKETGTYYNTSLDQLKHQFGLNRPILFPRY